MGGRGAGAIQKWPGHTRAVLPSSSSREGSPSPSLETLRPRKPNPGPHLGAASAAGPTVPTVVLIPVPPPRHAARRTAAEPSERTGSTEGTVGTPAGARTAARRAGWPARRRTRSGGLPEALGGAAGVDAAVSRSAPGRGLQVRTQPPPRASSSGSPPPPLALSPPGAT